jgi:serine O-acetyltransferase
MKTRFMFLTDLDVYAYRLGLSKKFAFLMVIIYPATWAILTYRFGHWIINLPTIFKWILFPIYFFVKRLTEILTGIQIDATAKIGSGIFIAHLGDIVIGHHSEIGDHPSIHQGVTIGASGTKVTDDDLPNIGNCVYFGAGSKILGRVYIGNNVVIGANSVVIKSCPENAIIAGVPGKIINYNGSFNFIHYREKKNPP